jgi:hypothetical protein
MLESREKWEFVAIFINDVMKSKEDYEREKQKT